MRRREPAWLEPYRRAVEERDLGIFEVGSSPVAKTVLPDSARQGIAEAAARRALADRLRAEAMLDLADWLRAGHDAGLTVAEMARIAGLSRPTVYALLREPE
jgi:DNA-binding transcriptional ArsR family regulator